MKSVIAFRDGRRVSLAGAIDAELYAELERTHSPRKDPVIFCGGCGSGIYLRHGVVRKDELFGAHHDAGECAHTFIVRASSMSDEHKRQAEYHAVAARSQGLDADLEVTMTGRTRVDVVVDGRIGFEVQRSALTSRAAVDRTARSIASGLEMVAWCGERSDAQWNGKVPGYRILESDWSRVPPVGSVKAAGVWTVKAVPSRFRRGAWEAALAPAPMLTDDIVARLAEGAIKPVTGKYVRLMTAEGIALHEELTGRRLAPYEPGRPPARRLSPAAEAPCGRPQVTLTPVPARAAPKPGICSTPECGKPARLYPAGWRCDGHRPGASVALCLGSGLMIRSIPTRR